MDPLPATATDAELISFIDRWAALLECEDYAAAYSYTDQIPEMRWSPELMRQVIKSYGDARPGQRVTVIGVSSDVTQRKQVDRWEQNNNAEVGEVWYDLNIDGVASDLTSTFRLVCVPHGIVVRLNDM
jgi:hypothetical protein